MAEWLVAAPLAACLVRWLATWRSMLDSLRQPLSIAILAAGVWGLTTVLWSSDRVQGLDELASFRHALLVPALWPLRDRRGLLIAALVCGFGLGHLAQICHAIGVWGDIWWLRWRRLPDRNSGWWDPVVGGSLLTAAVGLHLPAALGGAARGRGVGRAGWLVGIVGLCAAIAGVVASGTRGAWLASAAMVGMGVLWSVGRAIRRGTGVRRRGVLAIVGLGVLSVVIAGIAAGPTVMARAGRGVDEVRRAIERQDFGSDTGRRLFMWLESWRALREHPAGGVGAGGIADWARDGAIARGIDPGLALNHAHGMWVHVAATQGMIGLAAWGAVVGVGVWSGVQWKRRHLVRPDRSRAHIDAGLASGEIDPRAARLEARDGAPDLGSALSEAYALGPVWALVGLMLAGVFDTVEVNSQTAMLVFGLLALCAMGREAPARRL